jgi:hypothetical protein
MAYTPNTWATGDTITAQKLNNMEQGIAGAGALFVNIDVDFGTLDKTWQEIHDASLVVPVMLVIEDGPYVDIYYLTNVSSPENQYTCVFIEPNVTGGAAIEFTAATSSSYPVATS